MPPVESEADRAAFFDADEFAQVAYIDGEKVTGYFDEETVTVDDLAEVPIRTTNPTFTCSSSSIPEDAEEDTPVRIVRDDGTEFHGSIKTIEPDGLGITLITLKK